MQDIGKPAHNFTQFDQILEGMSTSVPTFHTTALRLIRQPMEADKQRASKYNDHKMGGRRHSHLPHHSSQARLVRYPMEAKPLEVVDVDAAPL